MLESEMALTHYSILNYAGIPTETLMLDAQRVGAKNSDRPGKSDARRRSYFAGRAAIAKLFHHLGVQGTVSADPFFGFLKAKMNDGSKAFINLSHTQEIAVAVFSTMPVGIDVESVDRDASRVLQRVAQKKEMVFPLDHKLSTPHGEIPFGISLWSAKEAFSKAIGLGIKFGMQHLEINLHGTPLFQAETKLQGPLTVKNPAVILERFENYVVAICGEKTALASGLSRFIL